MNTIVEIDDDIWSMFEYPDTSNWEKQDGHMTVRMGKLNPSKTDDALLIPYLGRNVLLEVTEVGQSAEHGVVALGIASGIFSQREYIPFTDEEMPILTTDGRKPHITVFVNRAVGGKPFYSNKITEWIPVEPKWISGRLVGEVKD
jgi:hypothetical protein